MKDTGFGVSIEVVECPEGIGLHIRNDLAEREMIEWNLLNSVSTHSRTLSKIWIGH